MTLKFLNYGPKDPVLVTDKKFLEYQSYLSEIQEDLPVEVYEFATARWHYNSMEHRCPHDSWLQRLEMMETPLSSDDKQHRRIDIPSLAKIWGRMFRGAEWIGVSMGDRTSMRCHIRSRLSVWEFLVRA